MWFLLAGFGLALLPFLFLRWLCTPLGLVVLLLCLPAMVFHGLYDIFYGPIGADELQQYVSIGSMTRGPHDITGAQHQVVTLRVSNSNPKRSTPADLWVGCRIGTGSIVVMDAAGLREPNSELVEQVVLPRSTAQLDFDPQAGLPSNNLRSGDAIERCRPAANREQAMAAFHE